MRAQMSNGPQIILILLLGKEFLPNIELDYESYHELTALTSV